MEATDFDVWVCELDPEIRIFLLNPDKVDDELGVLANRLTSSHGLALYGDDIDPIIFLDSRLLSEKWFTENHFQAIIAHELGHIHQQSPVELHADLYGIRLLVDRGYSEAAAILQAEHEHRISIGWYDHS